MPMPAADDMKKLYEEAKALRSPFEPDMRSAAAYCLPRHYSSWLTDGPAKTTNRAAARRFAYDNTGARSVPKYVAILNRLGSPESQEWHKLRADNPDLMKLRNVQVYFTQLNDLLFKMRYDPKARFTQMIGETYSQIGVYGMGPNALTWRKKTPLDPRGGFSYKAWSLRDVFILVDDEGNVTHIFRRFYVNARQYRMKFGTAGAPKGIAAELAKTAPSEERYFEFVQCLCMNDDYEKDTYTDNRFPIKSVYLSVTDTEYCYPASDGGQPKGFLSFPILTPRTNTDPDNPYGFSAAQIALPAMGSVSQMKKTTIKQGHKAVDPALLAHDDGVLSGRIDLRPGRITPGGISSQGQLLVQPVPMGDFRVAETLIADERKDIEDSFFVLLFQILQETPEMTATEVVERIAEKASLLSPTMGRLQSEQFGPQIEREIQLLAEHGMLPEMPFELVEARGQYSVKYTSPMAKGMNAEEVSGFMRWLELLLNYVQATQDPSVLDYVNIDEAAPEIADYLSVRPNWVADTKTVNMKQTQRSKQQQQQQVADQAPAIASVYNTLLKRGGSNTPGVTNG